MNDHALKAISTADKILGMVQDTLRPLDSAIRSWPADFRVIMWEAVASMANKRADEARGTSK